MSDIDKSKWVVFDWNQLAKSEKLDLIVAIIFSSKTLFDIYFTHDQVGLFGNKKFGVKDE